MHVTRYDEIEPFVTVDGSIIREWAGPHFTPDTGRVRVGDEERAVAAGDCVVIPPGTVHKLWATGAEPLVLVCSCSPPYSDADTVLVEDGPGAG